MHRQAASNTPPATISSMVVPQKPTLAQFEVMFEGTPLILERATDYWESGRVSSVQEIAPQLYHAQVSGSADDCYDVDIRLGKDAHGENANEANTDGQATTSSNSDHESTTDDNSIRIQSAAVGTIPPKSSTAFIALALMSLFLMNSGRYRLTRGSQSLMLSNVIDSVISFFRNKVEEITYPIPAGMRSRQDRNRFFHRASNMRRTVRISRA